MILQRNSQLCTTPGIKHSGFRGLQAFQPVTTFVTGDRDAAPHSATFHTRTVSNHGGRKRRFSPSAACFGRRWFENIEMSGQAENSAFRKQFGRNRPSRGQKIFHYPRPEWRMTPSLLCLRRAALKFLAGKPTLKGGKGSQRYRAENAARGWNRKIDVMKPAHENQHVSSL